MKTYEATYAGRAITTRVEADDIIQAVLVAQRKYPGLGEVTEIRLVP